MSAAGCRWGCTWGLETPLLFAPAGFEETPTLKRSNAFPIVAEECEAVRERVGLIDISGFSRYEVSGPGAEAWLDQDHGLAASRSGTGEARADARRGRAGSRATSRSSTGATVPGGSWARTISASGTCAGSPTASRSSERSNVTVRDISDATVGFGLAGPRSREVLAQLTHHDVSNEALPFMGCATLDVGLVRAKVGRLSVAGELGYEINVSAAEHIVLREMLLEAGRDIGNARVGLLRDELAAAGEELRNLELRVHAGLHTGDDRHGPLDRVEQG